jgi:hypothetical protein
MNCKDLSKDAVKLVREGTIAINIVAQCDSIYLFMLTECFLLSFILIVERIFRFLLNPRHY